METHLEADTPRTKRKTAASPSVKPQPNPPPGPTEREWQDVAAHEPGYKNPWDIQDPTTTTKLSPPEQPQPPVQQGLPL